MEYDYLIVGQGLSGTLLAHFLTERKQTVLVIDEKNPHSASRVAAGIINPITGRRIVKSWRIDEFLPFAKQTYEQLEELLDLRFFYNRNIIRALHNNKQENDWVLRSEFPGVQQYVLDQADASEYGPIVQPVFAWGELQKSAQVNIGQLISHYRQHLQENNQLLEEKFDYSALKLEDNRVQYQSLSARKVVFCEGYQSEFNPYLSHLDHLPAKGEVLIIKIPNFNPSKIAKLKTFLVPLGDDLFWTGSSYIWEFEDGKPTPKGKADLIEKLEQTLKVPYEIIEHKSGIRPVFKDRRPKVGTHPNHPQIAMLNGLGTKGASLGPYWANHLVDHLVDGTVIDKEVSY